MPEPLPDEECAALLDVLAFDAEHFRAAWAWTDPAALDSVLLLGFARASLTWRGAR